MVSEVIDSAALLRLVTAALGGPTHWLLLMGAALCLFECGVFVHERWVGVGARDASAVMAQARSRIGRVDVLARIGPMLGLMGTLIPLGPGLAALGRGDVARLAEAVTVAFDTTVLGLAIGIVGYGLGRARRGLYDRVLDRLAGPASEPGMTPQEASSHARPTDGKELLS